MSRRIARVVVSYVSVMNSGDGSRRPRASGRARDDREIGGIGFDAARRELAPFAQHPLAVLVGPMRRVRALVEEQHAVDVALGRRLRAEVARAATARGRRQHGLAIVSALHRCAIRAFKRIASRSCGSHHDHSQITCKRSAVVPEVASSVTSSLRMAACRS